MPRLAPILAFFLALGQARAEPHPLTLAELQERARRNDLRVQEAQDDLSVLEGKYKEAYWAWFPKFDSTFTFAGPTPEARNNGVGGPPTTVATREYDLNFGTPGVLFRFETSALLPIYTFGKLDALREAGVQGVAVGQHLKKRAEDEAVFQAAEAYFAYQLARQGKESLGDTVKQLDDAGKTLQKMLAQESAQVTKIDTYKLAFFRKEVEARASQTDQGMDLSMAAIRLLCGFQPDETFSVLADDLAEPAMELKSVEYYLDLAARNRPELRALNAGLIAREKEVFIREKLFFPDFGVAGFFRWSWSTNTTRQVSPFAYDPFDDLSGGIGLVAHQTFDFPIKSAQLDQARAEFAKLQTERKLAIQGIQLEVRKTYLDLRQALDRARAETDSEKNARRWATAANASFELGTTDTRDLMEAVAALAVASTEKLTAWHDAQVGLRALSHVVGMNVEGGIPPAP